MPATNRSESGCAPHLRAIIEAAMPMHKLMLSEFPWDGNRHRVGSIDQVLTPALVIYPDLLPPTSRGPCSCSAATPIAACGEQRERERREKRRDESERSVRNFKCATTLELLVACRAGAADVLLAYPVVGANAGRVRELAALFTDVRISVLAENEEQVRQWRGSGIGVFLDINPGMNRTGIEQSHGDEVIKLARSIQDAGLEFRGLHYYDGQYGGMSETERTAAAHAGYDLLLQLVNEIRHSGMIVPEVITAGTPTFPSSLTYEGFRGGDSFTASPRERWFIAMPPVSRNSPASTDTLRPRWFWPAWLAGLATA